MMVKDSDTILPKTASESGDPPGLVADGIDQSEQPPQSSVAMAKDESFTDTNLDIAASLLPEKTQSSSVLSETVEVSSSHTMPGCLMTEAFSSTDFTGDMRISEGATCNEPGLGSQLRDAHPRVDNDSYLHHRVYGDNMGLLSFEDLAKVHQIKQVTEPSVSVVPEAREPPEAVGMDTSCSEIELSPCSSRTLIQSGTVTTVNVKPPVFDLNKIDGNSAPSGDVFDFIDEEVEPPNLSQNRRNHPLKSGKRMLYTPGWGDLLCDDVAEKTSVDAKNCASIPDLLPDVRKNVFARKSAVDTAGCSNPGISIYKETDVVLNKRKKTATANCSSSSVERRTSHCRRAEGDGIFTRAMELKKKNSTVGIKSRVHRIIGVEEPRKKKHGSHKNGPCKTERACPKKESRTKKLTSPDKLAEKLGPSQKVAQVDPEMVIVERTDSLKPPPSSVDRPDDAVQLNATPSGSNDAHDSPSFATMQNQYGFGGTKATQGPPDEFDLSGSGGSSDCRWRGRNVGVSMKKRSSPANCSSSSTIKRMSHPRRAKGDGIFTRAMLQKKQIPVLGNNIEMQIFSGPTRKKKRNLKKDSCTKKRISPKTVVNTRKGGFSKKVPKSHSKKMIVKGSKSSKKSATSDKGSLKVAFQLNAMPSESSELSKSTLIATTQKQNPLDFDGNEALAPEAMQLEFKFFSSGEESCDWPGWDDESPWVVTNRRLLLQGSNSAVLSQTEVPNLIQTPAVSASVTLEGNDLPALGAAIMEKGEHSQGIRERTGGPGILGSSGAVQIEVPLDRPNAVSEEITQNEPPPQQLSSVDTATSPDLQPFEAGPTSDTTGAPPSTQTTDPSLADYRSSFSGLLAERHRIVNEIVNAVTDLVAEEVLLVESNPCTYQNNVVNKLANLLATLTENQVTWSTKVTQSCETMQRLLAEMSSHFDTLVRETMSLPFNMTQMQFGELENKYNESSMEVSRCCDLLQRLNADMSTALDLACEIMDAVIKVHRWALQSPCMRQDDLRTYSRMKMQVFNIFEKHLALLALKYV